MTCDRIRDSHSGELTRTVSSVDDERTGAMTNGNNDLDRAGRQAAYIANEWSNDPAIMQTQALCYVGIQLERIADALEEE
ncbi:hypothetical protein DV706_11100 [Natronorubrum bangense]|uniref:Uncharacterized protein n=3 Tax=Natronorubrum bangense TaxID=61858 RepID=L9W9E5_9EURY|nr:hypothetical protein C494_16833 [Natronorubrum bangense JCM 10635]QCC54964.1 hypothetical protein DV706_11100 [Natronorubrum bangense]